MSSVLQACTFVGRVKIINIIFFSGGKEFMDLEYLFTLLIKAVFVVLLLNLICSLDSDR